MTKPISDAAANLAAALYIQGGATARSIGIEETKVGLSVGLGAFVQAYGLDLDEVVELIRHGQKITSVEADIIQAFKNHKG